MPRTLLIDDDLPYRGILRWHHLVGYAPHIPRLLAVLRVMFDDMHSTRFHIDLMTGETIMSA